MALPDLSNTDERGGTEIFKGYFNKGKKAARTVLYARTLLLFDTGEDGPKWIVTRVAEALGTSPRSLEHLKNRFEEEVPVVTIKQKKRLKSSREIQT